MACKLQNMTCKLQHMTCKLQHMACKLQMQQKTMYEGCSEIIETFFLSSLKYLINPSNFTKILPRTLETNVPNFNAIT
jgi:hypothetical protein